MSKPNTTKVIMAKLMIIKLIMAKPTKNEQFNYGKITMNKLIMGKISWQNQPLLNLKW
jgi:hypothetical protein